MGIFKDIADWFSDLGKKDVNLNEEKELMRQLAQMEANQRKQFEDSSKLYIESETPKDKEFEYLEAYVPIDEDTLRKTSEDKYTDLYNEEIKNAEDKYQERLSNVEKREQGYLDDAETRKEYYNDVYNGKKNKFNSTASKNGIADSSIASSKKEDIDKEKDLYINEVLTALKNKLDTTASTKEELLKSKDEKIDSLNESFSKKVDTLFNKLLEEENKKVKDVEKANEQTAAKEKEFNEYKNKKISDAKAEVQRRYELMKANEQDGLYGSVERMQEFENRYQLAKDFYSKFTKKSAIQNIENNEPLKNFLGAEYFKLLKDIKNG